MIRALSNGNAPDSLAVSNASLLAAIEEPYTPPANSAIHLSRCNRRCFLTAGDVTWLTCWVSLQIQFSGAAYRRSYPDTDDL